MSLQSQRATRRLRAEEICALGWWLLRAFWLRCRKEEEIIEKGDEFFTVVEIICLGSHLPFVLLENGCNKPSRLRIARHLPDFLPLRPAIEVGDAPRPLCPPDRFEQSAAVENSRPRNAAPATGWPDGARIRPPKRTHFAEGGRRMQRMTSNRSRESTADVRNSIEPEDERPPASSDDQVILPG